jgi:hypothetical protein
MIAIIKVELAARVHIFGFLCPSAYSIYVIWCLQCEREYHVGCLKKHGLEYLKVITTFHT